MRMDKGKSFMHIEEEAPMPDLDEIQADDERARKEGFKIRVFSEMFLYPRVGKGDARFILGVAEEYEHIIQALGPAAIRAILDVKPRLVQRLSLPEVVTTQLLDARSDESLRREEDAPSQVILDDHQASSVWQLLHDEYQRYFDPENDMDREHLRTYHFLTDALGDWHQRQRKEEQERLPEKLEKKKARQAEIAAKRAARAARE